MIMGKKKLTKEYGILYLGKPYTKGGFQGGGMGLVWIKRNY